MCKGVIFFLSCISCLSAMTYQKVDDGYLVKVFPGEEIVASLLQLAEKEHILGASVTGIGGVKEVEIGYFDLKKNDYVRKKIQENLELVSLLGNFSYIDSKKPFYHLHATLGTRSYKAIAGHLFSAVVSITAEIHLITFSEKIVRSYDPTFRLNLWNLNRS